MRYYQLTFDGEEVPYEQTVMGPARQRPLTPVQEDILRYAVLNRKGWIRSVEAGNILHAHRHNGRGCQSLSTGIGCCKYASTDGSEACQRLAKRGLLVRTERGVWTTVA